MKLGGARKIIASNSLHIPWSIRSKTCELCTNRHKTVLLITSYIPFVILVVSKGRTVSTFEVTMICTYLFEKSLNRLLLCMCSYCLYIYGKFPLTSQYQGNSISLDYGRTCKILLYMCFALS